MPDRLHRYQGQAIEVTWSSLRCIHVAECLRRLGVVFDTRRAPWVTPDAADADEVAATILYCPSGALHFARTDGGADERPDAVNTIVVQRDGPLYVRGDLRLQTEEGEVVMRDTRLALCRCGKSQNKPFCDNSHRPIEFRHDGALGENRLRPARGVAGRGLTIVPEKDGPLRVRGAMELRGAVELRGAMELRGADGETVYTGHAGELCRCGHSGNKPFCDNTHERIGFKSE